MRLVGLSIICLWFPMALWGAEPPRTEITKWQDGKRASVSLTFDDGSINQFRIGIPLMNARGIPGTFFINTGRIPGSRYQATFVGRPPMDIIGESQTIPTTRHNVGERTSMLRYLKEVARVEQLRDFNVQRAGSLIGRGQSELSELCRIVDAAMAKLRQSGATFAVRPAAPRAEKGYEGVTWEEFRRYAAQGHEFANHTISHTYLSALDEANLLYEMEKASEDLRANLGPDHAFSFALPYRDGDERVLQYIYPRFPLNRNRMTDDFIDEILGENSRSPKDSPWEYVKWQLSAVTDTPLETMNGWIDSSIEAGAWLVLVIHGIEGIGYEALPTEKVKAFYDYIKEREGGLWVATFRDAAKYARERMKSAVATKPAGDAIQVSVTHSLDPGLYNLPLTVRTTVPPNWEAVRFRQGNETRRLPVRREGGNAYVMYRISPNLGAATLERASD